MRLISASWDPASISALAAIFGSLTGALSSSVSTWSTYALLSRIRLSSPLDVLASAEQVVQHIISTYSEPNLSPEEIQLSADTHQDEPLREFSYICRAELESMQKHLR